MSTQRPDVVVAGHFCIDIVPTLTSPLDIQPGDLVEVGPAAVSTGGAVANVGHALRQLGARVRQIGKVGGDALGRLARSLITDSSDFIVADSEQTSYSIVLSPPGQDRAFLHFPGCNATFRADEVPLEILKGAKVFHFGYPPLMRAIYEDGGIGLARLFEAARKQGTAVSLDMSLPDAHSEAGKVDWRAFLEEVLPHVDFFLPSGEELAFSLSFAKNTDYSALARECLDMGCRIVGVKLGKRGMILLSSERTAEIPCLKLDSSWADLDLRHACFKANVIGTTGSGDATIAGLLFGILRRDDPANALELACAVGATCCEAADAQTGVAALSEIERRLKAGWPKNP